MASHDPKQYADLDFYDLLGLNSLSEQKDIDAAWRRFALKYHPDKVGNAANEKTILLFHSGSIGRDILSDPSARAIYDNARAARLQEQQRHQVADEERQQHINNLLRREAAAQAAKQPSSDGYSRYDQHGQDGVERIKKVRGQNMALMEKYLAHLQAQQREAKMAQRKAKSAAAAPQRPIAKPTAPRKLIRKQFAASPLVPLSDRTIEARFQRTVNTQSVGSDDIKQLFSVFGAIEVFEVLNNVDSIGSGPNAANISACIVAFKSIYSAFMAVNEWTEERQNEKRWSDFLMVNWVSMQEPTCVAEIQPAQGELKESVLTIEEQHAIRIKKLAYVYKVKKLAP